MKLKKQDQELTLASNGSLQESGRTPWRPRTAGCSPRADILGHVIPRISGGAAWPASAILPFGAASETRLLLAARGLPAIGDGFVSLLLPVYLLVLGHGPFETGVIATATLAGSALLTLLVGPGERYDVVWTARNPGKWLLHCHINHHVTNDGAEVDGGGGMTMIIDVAI